MELDPKKLAREYRPSMPTDVLHLWARDVVAYLEAALSPSPAPGVVDRVLDAAAKYMIEQYGIGALHHKVDRQRIKAALASLSQPAKGEREGDASIVDENGNAGWVIP